MTTQVVSTLRSHFKRSAFISLFLATILLLSLGIWITLSSQPTSASRAGLSRAAQAEADRYAGLAEQYQARGRVIQAQIGRLNGQAQAYHRQRAIQAETERLNALAKAYFTQQEATRRSLEAWAARYTAQAEAYLP